MSDRFHYSLDFDCEGEDPQVYFRDDEKGYCHKMDFTPICTAPKWSWSDDDWKLDADAEQMLAILNRAYSEATR